MTEGNKSEAQKAAEADVEGFRKDLGPFVVAAQTTRMPMVFTDAKEAEHPIIFANESFLSLIGDSRENVLGRGFNSLMARGTDPAVLQQLESAFASNSDQEQELHCRRKDGSEFWASFFVSPVREKTGDVVQHFVSLRDVTRHKEEQARARVLIDELNHRVKNTLATVQSFVWQTLRRTSDPQVIRKSIEGRILALSRSHDLLTRENWTGAGLLDLVNEALHPFRVAADHTGRFSITGENIALPPKVTLALGIALYELGSNAVKYGALSNASGSVSISWAVEPLPGDRVNFEWREKDGPPVAPPARNGFGSVLIERGLPHELEGSVHLDYQPGGVICTINLPAPRGPS